MCDSILNVAYALFQWTDYIGFEFFGGKKKNDTSNFNVNDEFNFNSTSMNGTDV